MVAVIALLLVALLLVTLLLVSIGVIAATIAAIALVSIGVITVWVIAVGVVTVWVIAVGVVTVLSAAENIAKYPTKRSALFILFTAEEKGLLGSNWYVNHPVIPLEKMVYCFNSDNGGYNDTSLATIIGFSRTTAQDHIDKATATFGLKAIEDPAPEQGLFDRSDNVNFAAKGIPAPTFSMGFTAFDAEIGKYYHQTTDNPDTMDYDYLEKFFKSYVLACRLIANDPVIPFWKEGDKYYDAGVKLYGRKGVKN